MGKCLIEYLIDKTIPRIIESKITKIQQDLENKGHTVWRLNNFIFEEPDLLNCDKWGERTQKIDIKNKTVIYSRHFANNEQEMLEKLSETLDVSFFPQQTKIDMFGQLSIHDLTNIVVDAHVTNIYGEGDIGILCQLIRNYKRDAERVTKAINKNHHNQ